MFKHFCIILLSLASLSRADVQITIDPQSTHQIIDGFGSCFSSDLAKDPALQKLFLDDLQCSILRIDLTPRFTAPYANDKYNSPWFYSHSQILTFPPGTPSNDSTKGGPDHNNCRTYTSSEDYSRDFGGRKAPIAVMSDDINANIKLFDLTPFAPIELAQRAQKQNVKLIASLWSPAPWLKISSGNTWQGEGGIMAPKGTPWPFIWGGNFAGGYLDTSDKPLAVFNNTSALTQFARSTAAYVKGLQDKYAIRFYALSIQNELNFEQFYNSCSYPLSSQYLAALKTVRAEFAKYPDLKSIKFFGPEDLMGNDAYSLWQFGPNEHPTHKNLQYLKNIGNDPAIDFLAIHGYASDGAKAAGADPTQWHWWSDGWKKSPAAGIPSDIPGFTAYHKPSWMTETSGEQNKWLEPSNGFPSNGAFSIAVKIHQALVEGNESAWIYWQFAEGSDTTPSALTSSKDLANSPKYDAAKHFFKFIPPGSVRIEAKVDGSKTILASAYTHGKDLTLILINESDQPTEVRLNALPLGQTAAITSADRSLFQPMNVMNDGDRLKFPMAGYSVTTVSAQLR